MLLYQISSVVQRRQFCRHDWHVPLPDAYGQALPPTGPPFNPWTASQDPSVAYCPVAEPTDDNEEEEDA